MGVSGFDLPPDAETIKRQLAQGKDSLKLSKTDAKAYEKIVDSLEWNSTQSTGDLQKTLETVIKKMTAANSAAAKVTKKLDPEVAKVFLKCLQISPKRESFSESESSESSSKTDSFVEQMVRKVRGEATVRISDADRTKTQNLLTTLQRMMDSNKDPTKLLLHLAESKGYAEVMQKDPKASELVTKATIQAFKELTDKAVQYEKTSADTTTLVSLLERAIDKLTVSTRPVELLGSHKNFQGLARGLAALQLGASQPAFLPLDPKITTLFRSDAFKKVIEYVKIEVSKAAEQARAVDTNEYDNYQEKLAILGNFSLLVETVERMKEQYKPTDTAHRDSLSKISSGIVESMKQLVRTIDRPHLYEAVEAYSPFHESGIYRKAGGVIQSVLTERSP